MASVPSVFGGIDTSRALSDASLDERLPGKSPMLAELLNAAFRRLGQPPLFEHGRFRDPTERLVSLLAHQPLPEPTIGQGTAQETVQRFAPAMGRNTVGELMDGLRDESRPEPGVPARAD